MNSLLRLPLQIIAYIAFAIPVGYFATMPTYHYANPEMAGIKLSLSHAADRVEACVQLTQEEIAEFAANMRRTETCGRERLPVTLELDVDGEPVIRIEAQASGLWNDGPSSIYERFEVEPGQHRITVKLRDTDRTDGWDYEKAEVVTLMPGRYFTVTFRAETGGFSFR